MSYSLMLISNKLHRFHNFMRQIYQKCKINEIQQGFIINGCMAEKYDGKNVFGIIITPRCDIENEKVPTIHYLPIVSFDDWIQEDFKEIFCNRAKKHVYGNLKSQCNNWGLSNSIIDTLSQEQIVNIINASSKKAKQKESFASIVKDYGFIQNKTNIKELYQKYSSLGKQIITDLYGNNIGNFYILESWDSNDTKSDYVVVLLRDVKHITFAMGKKIAEGLEKDNIIEKDWLYNDLNPNVENGFYYPLMTLSSPYMEHLIQSFFHNFGRIGIENLDKSCIDWLFDQTKKVI